MLLEFRFRNYKSFLEETVFSMLAAPKQKGLDYSLFVRKYRGRTIKTLCSSVLYGHNAAGKTNVIGAIDTFRAIVLRGNIRNAQDSSSPNVAANRLELIPNSGLTESKPVEFGVDFVVDQYRVEYHLTLDLGRFLAEKHRRRVLAEKLAVNDEPVFERLDGGTDGSAVLRVNESHAVAKTFSSVAKNDHASAEMLARDGLDGEELFLTNGFKLIFSQKFSRLVTDWFEQQLMVVYRADAISLKYHHPEGAQNKVYVSKPINQAVAQFGSKANELGYQTRENSEDQLVSLLHMDGEKVTALPAEVYESYGTIRFMNLFPLVLRALKTGATLVVDEFDASIHPLALLNMVNLFHNDEVNTKQAQLIFNTHDTSFLDANVVRRDEIKFVERDEETHLSTLFALSDFGTSGKRAVRKAEDYRTHYLQGVYGGIVETDFAPILDQSVHQEDEV